MTESQSRGVLVRGGLPIFLCWLLVPLTFLLITVDSTRAPYFSLTDSLAQFSYWISFSASSSGAPFVGVLLLVLLVTRKGIDMQRRCSEAVIVLLVSTLFAGGGSWLNEHVLKEKLSVPRPNIVWLAQADGSGPLGMTPQRFYESGDKSARSDILRGVLDRQPALLALSPKIRAHWIHETGYSFPSGHSFAAFFFASSFLLLAISFVAGKRLWFFYLLLPWAVAVCYSRPILRVHTPADITIGALQGIVVGVLVWATVHALVRVFGRPTSVGPP